MYSLSIQRSFTARHFLFGGDWGDENRLHTHQYTVEIQLKGDTLDQHGYLVDIVEVEKQLEKIRERFSDKNLNEISEFSGLNPSIEHFARIFFESMSERIKASNISAMRVTIGEDDKARASYRKELL